MPNTDWISGQAWVNLVETYSSLRQIIYNTRDQFTQREYSPILYVRMDYQISGGSVFLWILC